MARDGNPRRGSLVFPILLIALGAIFLYSNWHPAFDPWPVLWTYWPLLLILVGLGMFWDTLRQRENSASGSRFPIGSTLGALVFVLALAALLWHGRTSGSWPRAWHAASASVRHDSRTIESQGAKMLRLSIDMPAGELTVSSGSDHLLDADFSHAASWDTPKFEYNVSNGTGELKISQDGGQTHIGKSDNTWTLKVNKDMPIDLKIDMGAGQGNLRLRDVDVTNLELNIGAGEVNVDLTGARKTDMKGDIEGGVGQANIRLPKNVGVIVRASGGIGSIEAHGFKHEGGEYTNNAYGKSEKTIRLKVEGGIGQINLIQEP
jgi:hypothetical protein